jgi:hypothetical protein
MAMGDIVDWLELARQARILADEGLHSASRRLLLDIAKRYETAAKAAELEQAQQWLFDKDDLALN